MWKFDFHRKSAEETSLLLHTDSVILRFLDRQIDRNAAAQAVTLGTFGPFGRAGSLINVVICAALIIGTVWFGITDSSFGFLVATVGLAMEAMFIRVAVRAYRGDFDLD